MKSGFSLPLHMLLYGLGLLFFFLFFFKPRGNANNSVNLALLPKLSSGSRAEIRETRKDAASLPPSTPEFLFNSLPGRRERDEPR